LWIKPVAEINTIVRIVLLADLYSFYFVTQRDFTRIIDTIYYCTTVRAASK